MDRLDDPLYEIISHIQDLRDRKSFSLVCRKWCAVESDSRQHVSIPFSYSTSPDQLHRRYSNLESLKIKGQHRATKFGWIREDWGGCARPWVNHLHLFAKLHSLHLCRMNVRDIDLEVIGNLEVNDRERAKLRSLKLENCWGFSTNGLTHVAKCRNLTTLSLEGSRFIDEDGKWFHELSLHNRVLETLHLDKQQTIAFEDLVRIATTCPLVSLKITQWTLQDLNNIWTNASNLQESAGVLLDFDAPLNPNLMAQVKLPPHIRSFHLGKMTLNQMPLVSPISHLLIKLDLRNTELTTDDHCTLLQDCPSLEVLQVHRVIGDKGLEVLGSRCRKLKRIFIDRDDERDIGEITDTGLLALSQGCPRLESVAAFVTSITNITLQDFATKLEHLNNFRVKVLGFDNVILDDGVRALLTGCAKLRVLHLGGMFVNPQCFRRIKGITTKLEWLSLVNVALADGDFKNIVRSFPYLKKLDIFGGKNIKGKSLTHAMISLKDLRTMWVKNCKLPVRFHHPNWKIEVVRLDRKINFILAYRSLVVQRNDLPHFVEHYLPHEL